jgi:hypothetical protein
MKRALFRRSLTIVAMAGLAALMAVSAAGAAGTQSAPAASPLSVTYYFLPG